MKTLLARLAVSASLALCASSSVYAQAPSLRPDVTIDAAVVKLGDVIANAGAAADAAVFHAPELGATGTIQAARIIAAAREHGLQNVEQNGFTSVLVRRVSREIAADDIRAAVLDALARRHDVPRDTILAFDTLRAIAVEARAGAPLRVASLAFEFRSGRFDAQVEVPGSAISAERKFRFTGSAGDSLQVPVLSRPLNRGDTIQAADLGSETRKRAELTSDMMIDRARLAGMALRRSLKAGQIMREVDLAKPELVERGGNVLVLYEHAGVQLSMRGKSLASGSMGDSVTVQNPQSKKVLEGRVSGPGRVTVRAIGADQLLTSSLKAPEQP